MEIDQVNELLEIPRVREIVERARDEGYQAGVNDVRNEIWQGLNNSHQFDNVGLLW